MRWSAHRLVSRADAGVHSPFWMRCGCAMCACACVGAPIRYRSGNLTSFDGTSVASNASTVVTNGTWGDPVCDGGVLVYSHTALAVTFFPPKNASYKPAGYNVQVSQSPTFPLGATTSLSLKESNAAALLPDGSLGFVVPGLTTGVAYHVRVAPDAPPGPSEGLPVAVPPAFTTLGAIVEGVGSSCLCSAVASGPGCGAPAATPSPVAPLPPTVGTLGPAV